MRKGSFGISASLKSLVSGFPLRSKVWFRDFRFAQKFGFGISASLKSLVSGFPLRSNPETPVLFKPE